MEISVRKQLQVRHYFLLDWRRTDPDLHVAQKTRTDSHQICDQTNRDRHESVLTLIWILSRYETLEMTSVNGAGVNPCGADGSWLCADG